MIVGGGSQVTLLVGSEAISTIEHFARRDPRPDFTEHAEGSLEDRGYGLAGMMSRHLAAYGLTGAPSQYALIDNARRARLKQTRQEYAAAMGALFAPFTNVAAANPHAAAPVERSAAELVTPTETNRPIADPYTRYIVAREKVNQGAAVVLTSVAAARRLGIPADCWVFLHGHADLRERDLTDRADLSAGPASVMAVRHALDQAGISAEELATIDLYSCFAAPVFNICDGLGLDPEDPRGLTVTGGLPFFGGPRDGARTGIVVGRLDADGSRFVAKGDDLDLLDLLTEAQEPIGQPVYVRSFGPGNRVTTTRARMDELFPPEPLPR